MSDRPKAHGKPFPPGISGNSKGRPKGSLNDADLLHKLLKRTFRVRGRRINVATAIIDQQFAKAINGNKSAQKLIFEFRDKLGAGNDVTSEERENRSTFLSRPKTPDEYDFEIAPAREKERQFCAATFDRENPTTREVPTAILSGDDHSDNGRFEQALQDYASQASLSKKDLAEKPEDTSAKRNFDRAIARIGLLADHLVGKQDFEAAAQCVGKALYEDAKSDLTWIRLIGAHADMFRGNTQDAREFYCHFKSNRREAILHWENIILRDFAEFRKHSRSAPLMAEIETQLMKDGWRTTRAGAARAAPPQSTMTEAEKDSVMFNPRDLATADIYIKYSMLDEAAAVYKFLLEKHRFEVAHQKNGASELLHLIEVRLGLLARDYLFGGLFRRAIECMNELPPERLLLQAIRAHALMLLEQTAEAGDIYRRHRGNAVEGKLWESAILADFRDLTSKGHSNDLMHIISAEFNKPIAQGPLQVESRPVTAEPLRPQIASDEVPDLSERDDIRSAQTLMFQLRFEDALKVFRRRIKYLTPRFANGRLGTDQERVDRQIVVDGLSDIAIHFLLKHEIEMALKITEEALSFYPNAYWPSLRKAHALMLLNRDEEARPIYMKYLAGKASPERTHASVIREEFSAMRDVNLARPLMNEIEKLLPPAQSSSRISR